MGMHVSLPAGCITVSINGVPIGMDYHMRLEVAVGRVEFEVARDQGICFMADLHGISLSEFTTSNIVDVACTHDSSGHAYIRIKLDVSPQCLSLQYYFEYNARTTFKNHSTV